MRTANQNDSPVDSESEDSGRLHFLQRRDSWGNPYALWVLAAFVFTLPLIGVLLSQLRIENAVEQWLPQEDLHRQVLEWFEWEFGKESHVVVSWNGSAWDDPRVTTFAEQLRNTVPGQQTGILGVTTAHDVFEQMRINGIAEADARKKLAGVLIGRGENAPVAVLVQIDEHLANARDILDRIRSAALKAGVPAADLHLGGGPVTRLALDASVEATKWNPAAPWWLPHRVSPVIMSALISVVLTLAMLRSVRLAAMLLAISAYTSVATMALIPIAGGTMNMVMVVLPTLLMVLTLSGAIHVVNYWKHAALEDRRTAIRKAITIAILPCLLAVVTEVIGMLSLLTSQLRPVKEFGIYSAIGTVLSLGVILYGLPALLVLWGPEKIQIPKGDHQFWTWLGRGLVRHRRGINWSFVIVTLAAAAGIIYFRTETKLIRFFPENSQIVADYEFLENKICGVVPVDLIVSFGPEARQHTDSLQRMELVRRIEDSLHDHPDISGTLSLAAFRNPLNPPEATSPFLVKARYNRTVHELDQILADRGSPSSGLAHVVRTPVSIRESEERIEILPGSEVWRIKANSVAMTNSDYCQIISDLQSRAEKELAGLEGAQTFVTGTVPLFLRTQEEILTSLIQSFGWALLLIEIILVVLLRGFTIGTLAILPNVFPIAIVFGLISWCGVPVDIGSLMTASIALGVSIDGTVHALTWFEECIRKGLDRDEAIVQSLLHCGPSMWHTSAIICLGLLMLLGADLVLISRFGWLMAALVFALLFGDLIYLPTQLAGLLGTLIEKRARAEMAASAIDHRTQPVNADLPETLPAHASLGPPHFAQLKKLEHPPQGASLTRSNSPLDKTA